MTQIDSLAEWARLTEPSALQLMLGAAARPETLSLALGLPAPELFPLDHCLRAAEQVLGRYPKPLQYGVPYKPLIAHVVELMRQRGVRCREEQVFLTSGAQQGLSLLVRVLLSERDEVVLENLTYTGMRQALDPYRPCVHSVRIDPESGVDVADLAARLKRGASPKLIYVIPEGHNPVTTSMKSDKRIQLAELAERHRIPVIEDDAYGFMSYDGPAGPPIRAYSDDWVFYVGSFSKTFAPGLRVGWLVAPEWVMPALGVAKESADINTCTFSQMLLASYLDAGHFPNRLDMLRAAYRERRDVMDQALRRHFPEWAWPTPSSGFFFWVRVAPQADTTALLQVALETEGLAFVPGAAFGTENDVNPRSCLRLNFSYCAPSVIEDGVARLARAWDRLRSGSRGDAPSLSGAKSSERLSKGMTK